MSSTIPTNKKCQEIVASGIKKYHEGFAEELLKLKPCYDTFCNKVENWISCTEKSVGCEHKCQKKINENENVFWVYEDCVCKGIKIYEKGQSGSKTAGRVIETTTTTIANNALNFSTQMTETTTILATDQKFLTESLTTTLLQNPDIPDSTDPEGLSDLVIICIIAAAVICFSILAGGLVYLVKVKMQNRNKSDKPGSAARGNLPRFPRERENNYIEMANPSFVGTEVVEGVYETFN